VRQIRTTVDPQVRHGAVVLERAPAERGPGFARVQFRRASGGTAPLAQRLVVHSPTGMEWGYAGSGPADLALNVLALLVDDREAWRLHQDFKADVVARMPEAGGEILMRSVEEWLGARWTTELAAATDRPVVEPFPAPVADALDSIFADMTGTERVATDAMDADFLPAGDVAERRHALQVGRAADVQRRQGDT
jgi:hypothetical protein